MPVTLFAGVGMDVADRGRGLEEERARGAEMAGDWGDERPETSSV